MDAPKSTGKQAGLAALNLVFVLLILFGAQSLLRGHISKTAGLAILSLLVFGAYLLGYRFIERRRPPGTRRLDFTQGILRRPGAWRHFVLRGDCRSMASSCVSPASNRNHCRPRRGCAERVARRNRRRNTDPWLPLPYRADARWHLDRHAPSPPPTCSLVVCGFPWEYMPVGIFRRALSMDSRSPVSPQKTRSLMESCKAREFSPAAPSGQKPP